MAKQQDVPPDTTPDLPTPPTEKQPFEQLARGENTPDWLLAATKHKHNWCVGQLLTKAEFIKAVNQTNNEEVG